MSFARHYTLKSPTPAGPRPRAQSFVSGSTQNQNTAEDSADAPASRAAVSGPEPTPGDSRRQTAHYPDTTRQPVSREEIQFLAICSAMAFKKVVAAGNVDLPGATKKEREDLWRHEQVTRATEGRASGLRELMRADFRAVFARFLDLAGMTEQAFKVLMRTGKTRGGSQREDIEQCDKWIFGLLGRVKRLFAEQGGNANARTEAWLHEIVKFKEQRYGKPWTEWETAQRTQLYWTLKNRFNAMTDRGETKNRNKSQRRKSQDSAGASPHQATNLPGCEEDEKPF